MDFIISIIITWVIGLAIPLFVRYVIKRKPVSKKYAIAITVANFIVTFMIFIALESQSKTHFALYIMAFVSYWILMKEPKIDKSLTDKFNLS